MRGVWGELRVNMARYSWRRCGRSSLSPLTSHLLRTSHESPPGPRARVRPDPRYCSDPRLGGRSAGRRLRGGAGGLRLESGIEYRSLDRAGALPPRVAAVRRGRLASRRRRALRSCRRRRGSDWPSCRDHRPARCGRCRSDSAHARGGRCRGIGGRSGVGRRPLCWSRLGARDHRGRSRGPTGLPPGRATG